jgi:amino acid adenylation domain-containing protein
MPLITERQPIEPALVPDEQLHSLFEEQARRHPAAIAIVCGAQSITYHDLNTHADRLATYLSRREVDGQTVGSCLPSGIPAVVAHLATLKAGAVYIPLDPRQPQRRLKRIITHAGVRSVLTLASSVDTLHLSGVDRVVLDDPATRAAIDAETEAAPVTEAPAGRSNLAYIVFTSGSTGEPKGVMIEHRAIVNSTLARRQRYGNALGRLLVMSPLTFDAALGGIWWGLSSGAAVELPSGNSENVLRALDSALTANSPVTHVMGTPSVYQSVLLHVRGRRSGPQAVVLGGEALPPALVEAHFDAFPNTRLFNEYGPTEAAVWCAGAELRPSPGGFGAEVTVGTPIANTEVLVVAPENGALLPDGEVGELCIAGDNLFRGYVKQPGMTAIHLVPHPFRDGQRMYRTGDLGRRLDDGRIVVTGRIDDQVEIMGYRVEPGEIEAVLHRHIGVANAVVLATGQDAERRIAAFVVPDHATSHRIDGDDLRRYLRQWVPEYMVPASIRPVDELPRTPNGKIDRRALCERLSSPTSPPTTYDVSTTDLEARIARCLASVLGVATLAVDDDFFAAGGDSLRAINAVHLLQTTIDEAARLHVGALFQTPSAGKLATAIRQKTIAVDDGAVGNDPNVDGLIPFSSPQWYWLYMDHFRGPGVIRSSFVITVHYRISGSFHPKAFERAVELLCDRHETLRTALDFTATGGGYQTVLPKAASSLTLYDVSDDADPERAGERAVAAFKELPLEILEGCMLRVGVVRFSAADHALWLRMHHAVTDDWSIRIIERELSILYQDVLHERPASLPPLPVRYRDFAAWQYNNFLRDREWRDRGRNREVLNYWADRCHGLRPAVLPGLDGRTDRARIILKHTLDEQITAEMRSIALAYDTTLFTALMAAFCEFIAQTSGSDDVAVIGTHSFRHRPELETLVGLFFEPVLIRTELARSAPFSDRLVVTREAIRGALAHLDVPVFALSEEIEELSTYLLSPFIAFELLPPAEGLHISDTTIVRHDNFSPGFQGHSLIHPALLVLTAQEYGDTVRFGMACDPLTCSRERMHELLNGYIATVRTAAAEVRNEGRY